VKGTTLKAKVQMGGKYEDDLQTVVREDKDAIDLTEVRSKWWVRVKAVERFRVLKMLVTAQIAQELQY
jgi:hypothetical protein